MRLLLACTICGALDYEQPVDRSIIDYQVEGHLARPQHLFPLHATVLYGSSTLHGWGSADKDLGTPVINLSLWGGQTSHLATHADALFQRLRGAQVERFILYAGDNDLAQGRRSPEEIVSSYRELLGKIRNSVGNVPITLLSVKPSPQREQFLPLILETNRLLREFAQQNGIAFADVASRMLKDGKVNPEYYVRGAGEPPDPLHMNSAGYAVMIEEINKAARS
ncbi:MAG: hypothetical protein HY078_06565 [Elusimicrobia bacterium]|nr:hypothetical protein [Elusimicrobiota bacterium]